MLKHFIAAANQLDDRAFRSVLVRGLLSAIAALAITSFGARYTMARIDIPFWEAPDWILNVGTAAIFLASSWFLFPAIATAVMSLFLDDVVDSVENKHYPEHKAPKTLALGETIWMSLRLLLIVLVVNVLALPFYLLLLFTAIGPFVLFAGINGYLLGREYFEMVASRHISSKDAARLRRAHRTEIFLLGLGVTGLFMIPVINLIAPLVGAGAAVHSFHKIMQEEIAWQRQNGLGAGAHSRHSSP